MPKYWVLNENTLGFVYPEQPHLFNVLAGSVIRGGHDWKNGPVPFGAGDQIRKATQADFDAYRVSSKGHL